MLCGGPVLIGSALLAECAAVCPAVCDHSIPALACVPVQDLCIHHRVYCCIAGGSLFYRLEAGPIVPCRIHERFNYPSSGLCSRDLDFHISIGGSRPGKTAGKSGLEKAKRKPGNPRAGPYQSPGRRSAEPEECTANITRY